MDKIENQMQTFNHSINIIERKSIIISGIKKIENFDNEEFLLETNMGFLTIKGTDLEMIKLDTFQGSVSIKGKINSLNYTDNINKNKETGIFNKLFK